MTWKEFTYQLIIDYCNNRGSRTFTLQKFQKDNYDIINNFSKSAKTPFNTMRRVLQELRDDKLLSFIDNSGIYTLRGLELLEGEVEDKNLVKIQAETPEKKNILSKHS